MVRVLYSEHVEDRAGLLIGRDIGSRVRLKLDLATGTVSRSKGGALSDTQAEPEEQGGDSAETIDVIRYMQDNVIKYIDCQSQGVGTQPSPKEEDRAIYPVLPQQERDAASAVVAELVEKGDIVVEGLPDYRLSFRKLEEGCRRDCEGQEAAVYIELPRRRAKDTAALRIPRYEMAAYRKLEKHHQEIYRNLVQEFVEKGWWIKKDAQDREDFQGKECLPASPIFLTQLEKKPRLVLDCRGVNESLGEVSSCRRTTSDILLAVRLNGGDVLVADLQKAYYRCHLLSQWVLLATAIGEFVTSRMASGLHFGAGCLQGSLKEIIATMTERMRKLVLGKILLFIMFYMDDIVLQTASIMVMVKAFALLFMILRILGFVVQVDKLWAVVRPENREEFLYHCKQYGIDIPVKEEGLLLGVKVSIEGNQMVMDCGLLERWNKVENFLRATVWTKSTTFACAGALAHDGVQGHPTLRILADILRSVIGRKFNEYRWDKGFTEEDFDPITKMLFIEICKWIEEKRPVARCLHFASLQENEEGIHLVLETDSSLLGWGYTLWANRGQEVQEYQPEEGCFEVLASAGRWTNREAVWHSNRRELRAMFEGVSRTARFLDYWRGSHNKLGTQGPCRLSIKGDNFASIRWCNDNPPSKALELRATIRIAGAIKEEIDFIRNSCDVAVDMTHLQGVKNSRADYLSRILERKCANGVQIGRVMQENIDEPLKIAAAIDDIICRIGDIPTYPDAFEDRICYIPEETPWNNQDEGGNSSLAEKLALMSYDVDSALHVWKALRFSFTQWRRTAAEDSALETFPDTYQEADKASVARSLQRGWIEQMDCKAVKTLACIRLDDAGIGRYLVSSADGGNSWAYYVPKERWAFRCLMLRSAHRKLRHASRNATVERAIEFGFFAPSLRRLANDVLAVCVTCQLKNAKREWRILPGIAGTGVSDLSPQSLLKNGKEPFYAVSVDAITLGSGLLYLSVVCLMTYSVVWVAIPDQTSSSIAAAIRRAQRREGGFAVIVADNAIARDSVARDSVARDPEIAGWNIKFIPANPRAPWTTAAETHHRSAVRVARIILRKYRVSDWNHETMATLKQELADEITWTLNRTPLSSADINDQGYIRALTPDDLRYGYIRREGGGATLMDNEVSSEVSKSEGKWLRRREANLRRFLNDFWPEKRRKVLASLGRTESVKKDFTFRVGDPVMIYQPSRKHDMLWRTGWIVQCISTRRYRVRIVGGRGERITEENHYNLCPLEMRRDYDDMPLPDRAGMRIRCRLTHEDGSLQHHWGTIVKDLAEKVLVCWDVSDPGQSAFEMLKLEEEDWDFGDSEVDTSEREACRGTE